MIFYKIQENILTIYQKEKLFYSDIIDVEIVNRLLCK